ncbi:MAG TPA: hypothetical protein VKH37_11565, partial [Ferruginibacter sp.]|nr:hypothetical protein [Ferruginibacter sp.]
NWFYDKDTQEEIMTEERGENKRWCNSIIHITNSETCDRYDDDYIYRDYQCKHETGFRIDPKY